MVATTTVVRFRNISPPSVTSGPADSKPSIAPRRRHRFLYLINSSCGAGSQPKYRIWIIHPCRDTPPTNPLSVRRGPQSRCGPRPESKKPGPSGPVGLLGWDRTQGVVDAQADTSPDSKPSMKTGIGAAMQSRAPTPLAHGNSESNGRSAKRKTEVPEGGCAVSAAACVAPPGSDIAGSQGLHGEHGRADVATPFAQNRDAAIPHGEPSVHHLRHQGVEPDAPVALRCRRNHHLLPHPVYVRSAHEVETQRTRRSTKVRY
jgi:hypothetical protein